MRRDAMECAIIGALWSVNPGNGLRLLSSSGWGILLRFRPSATAAGAAYMLVAVVGLSFVPTVIALSDGGSHPFLFNAWFRLGFVAGCLLFLTTTLARLKGRRGVLSAVREQVKRDITVLTGKGSTLRQRIVAAGLLLCAVSNFDFALFAWSVRYVDVAVAAVLYEIWPISIIFATALLIRRRYERVNGETVSLLVMCFVGVTFVVISQSGDITIADVFSTAVGCALVMGAVAVTTLAVFGFRWGSDTANIADSTSDCKNEAKPIVLFYVIVAYAISSSVAVVINFGIGIAIWDNVVPIKSALLMIAGGAVLAFSAVCLRQANVAVTNLGVNAIAYGTPILSLVWLFILSQVQVQRADYLVIGAAAVAAANLLINFQAERLLGFKSLVVSLWVFGATAYLGGPVRAQLAGAGSWYFEALALSATVFTLLLSFRTARLVSRTREEDALAFALFHELRELSERGVVSPGAGEHILTIDSGQRDAMRRSYAAVRQAISQALERAERADRDKLLAAQARLDVLTHSRQQGINFGELCALFIFAAMTVALALFLRPAAQGLAGFLVDMFTMLFSSVIVFLAVNVFDLQRVRSAQILERNEAGNYSIAFRDAGGRSIEQWVTIVVGIAMVASYAGLLGYKWLGWFGA